jgi:hypothetical protein
MIFTSAYDVNHGHVKMCHDCGLEFSTTEQMLRHYKEDHKEDSMEEQTIVLPSTPEKGWIKFDIEKKFDFHKTQR